MGYRGNTPKHQFKHHTWKKRNAQGAVHDFRTLGKITNYDFFFIFISLALFRSLAHVCYVCLSVLLNKNNNACVFSKTISCGASTWENLFRLFLFHWVLFVCLLGCLCVRLDCWMSLIHFYLLIICMDGVFNEIGDRLIRRDNIKCTISQSLHPFYIRLCMCMLLLLSLLFWKFCYSILGHYHLQFSPTHSIRAEWK